MSGEADAPERDSEARDGGSFWKSGHVRLCSYVTLVNALLLSVILLAERALWNPRYLAVFEEMEIEGGLPTITIVAFGPTFTILLLVAAAVGVAKEYYLRSKAVSLGINLLHLAGVVLLWAAYQAALHVPFVLILEGIGD